MLTSSLLHKGSGWIAFRNLMHPDNSVCFTKTTVLAMAEMSGKRVRCEVPLRKTNRARIFWARPHAIMATPVSGDWIMTLLNPCCMACCKRWVCASSCVKQSSCRYFIRLYQAIVMGWSESPARHLACHVEVAVLKSVQTLEVSSRQPRT